MYFFKVVNLILLLSLQKKSGNRELRFLMILFVKETCFIILQKNKICIHLVGKA